MRKAPVLICLLALPLMVPVALAWLGRFDGLYGQDPFAYYDYATGPLLTGLHSLRLPPPFFWPPGYPLLAALAALLVGATPPAAQAVSLVAGILVPIFTAMLARELVSRRDGDGWGIPLLAGLLAALVGQLWQSSIVVMADTTALAAATVGMWALARHAQRPRRGRWLALAAAALAFAILTRWGYALVAWVATFAALWQLKALPRPLALRQALAAALVVAAILLPIWLPALTGATDPVSGRRAFAGDLAVYSWNPLNAFRRQFDTADGRLVYGWPNGLWYGLAPAHRYYFTLLAVFLPVGAWTVLRHAARRPQNPPNLSPSLAGFTDPVTAILLLIGWPLIIFVFHAGAPWQNFRFNLAHLPPLAILVASGIQTTARLLGRNLPARGPRMAGQALLAGFILLGMAAMASGGLTLTREFIARKNADLATVRWVESETEPEAELLAFNMTATLQHYSRRTTHELFYLRPFDLAELAASDRPLYLLADVGDVEARWQGQAPGLNFAWLRDGPGLEELGRNRNYTLFRVRTPP